MTQHLPTDDSPPSPDELLFELWDWLPLAFPRAIHAATLHIGPTANKTRGCLVDLDAETPADAPVRADLGYPDGEVLDNVNALLQGLLEAVAPRTGHITTGRLFYEAPDADGAMQCRLVDGLGATQLTRRIDKSERQLFVHSAALFAALERSTPAEDKLRARGYAVVQKKPRFALDTDAQTITFASAEGDATETFGLVFLATHHEASRNLVWADKNPGVPAPLSAAIKTFRQSQSELFLGAWQHAEHFVPLEGARRFTGHAAAQLGCEALVCLPMPGPEDTLTLHAGLQSLAADKGNND